MPCEVAKSVGLLSLNYFIMKKLELKHLTPYLPYGLKCDFKSDTAGCIIYGELTSLSSISSYECATCISKDITEIVNFEDLKPILRPLSDLNKEIQIAEYYCSFRNHLNRIYPSETIGLNIATWSQRSFIWLIERHFDVFKLIDKGLAIDINTL